MANTYMAFKGMTKEEQLDKAQKFLDENCNNSIIAKIEELMLSDDDDYSYDLVSLYKEASEEERMIMDNLLVYICGWSFGAVIDSCLKEGEEE